MRKVERIDPSIVSEEVACSVAGISSFTGLGNRAGQHSRVQPRIPPRRWQARQKTRRKERMELLMRSSGDQFKRREK